MHGPFSEFSDKKYRKEVEQAIDKAAHAEFGFAVFARTVFYYLLTDFGKSSPFSDYRDVSVHFPINLDVFYYCAAVGLQTAIEIVQVFNARHAAGGGVVYFGRNCFTYWVVTFGL